MQRRPHLDAAGEELIREANEAGGRDNITVVLFRVEELDGEEGPGEETRVDMAAPREPVGAPGGDDTRATAVAVASPPQSPEALKPIPAGVLRARQRATQERRTSAWRRRFAKPLAALLAAAIVVLLIGAGGYLASRQLYFIGTNSQGIVTIYRGFPYNLPFGINLYETYYVSGLPASLIPAERRGQLLNNNLRSQSDATSLVMDLEQGRVSR